LTRVAWLANRAFGAQFDPPMYGWRDDPYDNQTGEIEADGVGLYGDEAEDERCVLAWEEPEANGSQGQA